MFKQHVEMSHGTTHFLESGEGEPVILLHGVGYWTAGDYWLENISELSRNYHVFAPDFVGWGDGDRLPVEYSFSYLVDFIREFQDAVGISSAHIIGHSMGGWVAALFAYESPERVKSLTLVASGGMSTRTLSTMTEFNPPSYDEILQQTKQTTCLSEEVVALRVQSWYERIQLPGALDAYRKILKHMNNPIHRSRYNLQRRLPYVKAPTLIVWGSEDAVNPISMGEQMNSMIPGSEFVVLKSGHFIPSEVPEQFNQKVQQFLGHTDSKKIETPR